MLEIDFRKSVIDQGMDTAVDNAITFGDEIERLGYGGLWHGHSIVTDLPGLDALSVLSAVAARTDRIFLGSAVLQAPLYHPLDLARRAVTLDHLSRGRLILGVGTGSLEREFINLDLPYRRRASRLDEMLEVLKLLWTQEGPIDYEGEHFSFKDVIFLPKPVQQPHPKLVIGGVWHGGILGRPEGGSSQEWSERAITRIAKYGDGWITLSSLPVARAAEIVGEGVERIKERAKEYGRVITDDEFMMVGETGMVNVSDSKEKALEEGADFYNARVARGFHQSRGNPSMATHLETGCYGTAEEVADFMRQWIAVKKRVPSLKRIQVNLASLKLVQQLQRFHEEVFPLIEDDLREAQSL